MVSSLCIAFQASGNPQCTWPGRPEGLWPAREERLAQQGLEEACVYVKNGAVPSISARHTCAYQWEQSTREGCLCVPYMGLYLLPLATVSPSVKLGRAPGEGQAGKCLQDSASQALGSFRGACLLGQCRTFLPGAQATFWAAKGCFISLSRHETPLLSLATQRSCQHLRNEKRIPRK